MKLLAINFEVYKVKNKLYEKFLKAAELYNNTQEHYTPVSKPYLEVIDQIKSESKLVLTLDNSCFT